MRSIFSVMVILSCLSFGYSDLVKDEDLRSLERKQVELEAKGFITVVITDHAENLDKANFIANERLAGAIKSRLHISSEKKLEKVMLNVSVLARAHHIKSNGSAVVHILAGYKKKL